jgi:TatD DNase family protein
MEQTIMHSAPVIGYTLRGNRYLNITNRCTLRCAFCPKFNDSWTVGDYDLRLKQDPSVEELVEAVGDPQDFGEIVLCGMGEPTLRLYTVLDAATRLRAQGGYIRLNTDGLANLVYGRDVTPDLEGHIHALSVSLNAQDEATYNRHCRPSLPGSYPAMLDFVRRAREFVPSITLTAIDGLPGVDIAACRKIADDLGVDFRRRVLDAVG